MLKKTQQTWWEEAASDNHRQCLAHAGWQDAKDVMTILSIDGGSNYVYLPAMAVECMQ